MAGPAEIIVRQSQSYFSFRRLFLLALRMIFFSCNVKCKTDVSILLFSCHVSAYVACHKKNDIPNVLPASYLFVYGTLRKEMEHPFTAELRKYARWEGRAFLSGKLFLVDWYPGLVIPADQQHCYPVHGDLFQIRDADRLFPILDAYEGCSASDPLPHMYQREVHPIFWKKKKSVPAWVYRYVASVEGLIELQHGDFLIHASNTK